MNWLHSFIAWLFMNNLFSGYWTEIAPSYDSNGIYQFLCQMSWIWRCDIIGRPAFDVLGNCFEFDQALTPAWLRVGCFGCSDVYG